MSRSTASQLAKIVPAQLAFLAIYNPSLGPTDETAYDQIVYYYDRREVVRRKREKRTQLIDKKGKAKGRSAGVIGHGDNEDDDDDDDDDDGGHDEKQKMRNERLRQVGLARGIVEFANNFSNGVPVDSIETEKSHIILVELEAGWWVLASIDLTILPAAVRSMSTSTGGNHGNDKDLGPAAAAAVEYSAREVSPPALLRRQLLQAHALLLLHHAPSLASMYSKVGREKFCGVLARFWDRFVFQWDVLLHGSPAVDIYNCTKLAGGGELGIGVGEEEWGSGEREVLEGFASRTEGLVDLVVGRYGDAPADEKSVPLAEGKKQATFQELTPWLGNSEDPRASDGIIFSGTGAVSRRSLATISQWMAAIFKYGDDAFGVGENPSSAPRYRRKRRKIAEQASQSETSRSIPNQQGGALSSAKSPRGRVSDLRRKAIEKSATPPGIPAPLVNAVERSLEAATTKAQSREASRSPREEKSDKDAMKPNAGEQSSLLDSDKMMKYLTLGYGSSWTLNPKGFGSKQEENTHQVKASGDSSNPPEPADSDTANNCSSSQLAELDPTPEVSDEDEAPFVQRLEQSIGKFLIGLSGDLENAEFEAEPDDPPCTSLPSRKPSRIYLRTLTVQRSSMRPRRSSSVRLPPKDIHYNSGTNQQVIAFDQTEVRPTSKGKTSANASIDGGDPRMTQLHDKLQVAVYVHQPFIFVFLFDLHTPSLTMPNFYRGIHHQLGPLQKPLLHSTDPTRVAQRIADLLCEKSGAVSGGKIGKDADPKKQQTIYDLIYDPAKLTLRTSLPNIPVPGSFAAEGFSSKPPNMTVSGSWYTLGIPIGSAAPSDSNATGGKRPGEKLVKSKWTRIEALNVHTQVLNSWCVTRSDGDARGEIERTVKTGRGWWVLWMQVSDSDRTRRERGWEGQNIDVLARKEAFLVRKADLDTSASAGRDGGNSGSSGRWLLREQSRETGGGSNSPVSSSTTSTNARRVSEGVGVDARRWVETLLHLSQ